MSRFVRRRLVLLVPTLFGISLLTFLLLNLTPGSLVAGTDPEVALALEAAHRRAEQELGMRDPVTGELAPLVTRYGHWLARAVRFEFARRGGDEVAFRGRIARALPPTLLVHGLALWLAALAAVAVGTRLGMRAGSRVDGSVAAILAAIAAVPEVLLATLAILAIGGGAGLALFPVAGLTSPGAETWSLPARALDLLTHLTLPVLVVGLPVFALLARLVRDAVRRACVGSTFRAARGFGATPTELRAIARREGVRPLATVLPVLAASAVAGSLVVEPLFAIDGMGMLAWRAFVERDQPMVMALTLLLGLVTLVALVVSDLLHAWLDPRVRLA